MNWFKEIGGTELLFIALFIVLYLVYLFRLFYVARNFRKSTKKVLFKLILRTVYFVLILVAILGPSFGEGSREVKVIGKDIYIAVDLSQSMNANDIQPSRLEKVKFELKNIVDAFNSDRVGIIIFSNEAYVQCPLTYDQSAINLFIETLNTGLVPNAGTQFGPPLEMALQKINKESNPSTRPTSKIIILISDGEDFGSQRNELADKIDEEGIRLFTLGVGTEKGSRIRTANGFKKDADGNDVVTKLNPNALKVLAASTGGMYFEINDTQNDVNRLINKINEVEGELRDTRKMDVTTNKFYYFLALALILMALDAILTLKVIRL